MSKDGVSIRLTPEHTLAAGPFLQSNHASLLREYLVFNTHSQTKEKCLCATMSSQCVSCNVIKLWDIKEYKLSDYCDDKGRNIT